jgi:hypothetical protein
MPADLDPVEVIRNIFSTQICIIGSQCLTAEHSTAQHSTQHSSTVRPAAWQQAMKNIDAAVQLHE